MLDLNKAVELAAEAHEGQYRTPIKVFPVNEHTLENWEISKLQQNNGTDFSICKEDGEYSMNTHLELFIAEPYITHPLAVMNMMTTEEEKTVAVLHDVLEDTSTKLVKEEITKREWHGSLQTTYRFFIKFNEISYEISSSIYAALNVLNKTKSVKYEDYITNMLYDRYDPYFESTDKLIDKRLWIKVKLADIIHNLSGSPSEHARQKYMKAIPLLLNSL